ncbi:ATP-binding protein [Streptomyces sp. LS1784]|uniref:ATP-binding protein n=1 Tax=Streptomyces sp. LS1784 TaxID=2851533 RepID=UPI001CC94393|nr:ATP-binding protein [Streptomyces sp. LS1784]
MSALALMHLTSVGPDKPPASVEFGPHLTVIYGASETGKSYIVEAIDYMLGATKLKTISQADGYTHMLLGLHTADGQIVTLCREMGGTKVDVFEDDLRSLPAVAPNRTLNLKHDPKAENNLSRYLLKIVGVDGRRVLKNARRVLRTLSFRDLAHLCVITDTPMADGRSPVLASRQTIKETEDKSVFKLLLTGEDEPEGPTGASNVEKKVGKGKIELLDQLITQAQSRLEIASSESELLDQLRRLEESLVNASAAARDLVTDRSALVERERLLQTRTTVNRERIGELRTLIGRFGLLRQQYESDLDRLRMVAEAGSLLGYFFREGPCIFCGAAPEHQQPDHQTAETEQLQVAVAAEIRKTTELHADLLTTMDDLEEQLRLLEGDHASLIAGSSALTRELAILDQRLAPLNEDTKAILSTRSKVQADLSIHAQVQQLEEMRASLSSTPATPETARPEGIPASDVADFERTMHEILASWQLPGANRVSYDQKTAEISVDGSPRGSRGRGMRSVIHAAFTMALARYTAEHELPHPGFVVLDSPLLAYREPDEDFVMPRNVVGHFFQSLYDELNVQIIVAENVNPPQDLGEQATLHPFRTAGAERVGFYPAAPTG